MKRQSALLLVDFLVLLVLALGTALPAAPARAQEPQERTLAQVQTGSLAPTALEGAASTPLELAVSDDSPLKVPFKLDLDMMLGPHYNTTTYRVNQAASWDSGALGGRSDGQMAAVAAGGQRFLAVWMEQASNSLHSLVWWPKSGSDGVDTDLGLSAKGAPALVSLTPDLIVVLARDANDFIRYRWWQGVEPDPWAGSWQQVPGNYRVGSDLAAVSKDSNHIALFFRDSGSNAVKFSEWQDGVDWRSEPIDLGSPAGTQIVSELAAVSRNERHLAVFGVGQDNVLYYREWTTLNKSDWSDTAWTQVLPHVWNDGRISAASRHNNHMAVAVIRTDRSVAYQEWLAASGWGSPQNLGNPGFPPTQAPTIAVTALDEMMFLGVDQNSDLVRNYCESSGQCSGWTTLTGAWDPTVRATPVVRRPHDLIVLGRAIAAYPLPNQVQYARFSGEFGSLNTQGQQNHAWAQPGGQTIATVQGKTVWLGAAPMQNYDCQVSAAETSNWSVAGWESLDGQVCPGSGRGIAVDAGDLDGDGDDEMVLTTSDLGRSVDTTVVQIGYGGTPSAPSLSLNPEAKVTEWLNLGSSFDQQIDVAIGDLDGDGRQNEVVVGYNTTPDPNTPGTIGLYVYQYQEGKGLQLQTAHQPFSPWTKGGKPPASVWDWEIAVGRVRPAADDRAQVVLAAIVAVPDGKRYDLSISTWLYDWVEDARGARTLIEIERLYNRGPAQTGKGATPVGSYSIALATGDIDANGLDEVVFAHPLELYTSAGEGCLDCFPGDSLETLQIGNRFLAVGDIDGDSRAEILRAYDPSAGMLEVIEWGDVPHEVRLGFSPTYTETHLYQTGKLAGFKGVPLLADIDNDSLQAKLRECKDYHDVNVIAVVNGVPRFYEDDGPIQENGGGYAKGSTDKDSQEKGTTAMYGGSVTVGYEKDVFVPFVFKGKLSFEAESEFLGRSGQATETETSTTMEMGAKFEGEDRGMVVFRDSSYKCCAFDVYYATAPDDRSTTLSCTPATVKTQQNAKLLRDWHSPSFKAAAGPSWVDAGRASAPEEKRWRGGEISNDVYTYPSKTPVDPYLVKWYDSAAKIEVDSATGTTSLEKTWALEKGRGETQIKKGGFENRNTVSFGVETYGIEAKVAAIAGVETEWSHSVGWEETLSFEGEVYDYPDTCPPDVCKGSYTVQPFLWQATATTQAGLTYPYLELDYIVPDPPGTVAAGIEAGVAQEAIVGIAPQQPVVNSPTHPDPEAWSPARDVTLEWEQPAGDTAAVIGYRWNLNDEADFAPTALHRVMTDTMTFEGVQDGLHYFHLQARGDGGDDSPVARRALRVDATPPQVEIRLDPLAPDGFNGWYKTPVEATLAVTDGLGSGVASAEVSTDGATWQPYAAPLTFNTPTAGTTLWARATDQAGHTSEPVQAAFKIDTVAPTSVDSDGVGLSYRNLSTDEVGNPQLVLGGASEDTLAGRFMVEVKGGDTGSWRPVQAVDEFPIPPDNDLISTVKTIHWIYTPTHEIRGIYPLWGRSIDAAGNVEAGWNLGTFWWEPDGEPNLSQTRVSVKPRQAFPGDTVRFTLGLRNTGVQECQVGVVDRLPAELAPLPESISDSGEFNAGDGTIRWTLHDLWPGQTRYLTFDAQVNPGFAPSEPAALENHLEVEGYWPWEPGPGGPPPPPSHPYSTSTTLTVLPGAMAQVAAAQAAAHPPAIYTAKLLDGAIVDKPVASLYVHASPDTEFLYVKEWVWDHEAGDWALANDSGWLPFTSGDNLEVAAGATGKYGYLHWQLSSGDGVKFLGLWAANGDKHTTNLNEGHLLFTNLASASGQRLGAGQRVQYRLPLLPGQLGLFALSTESGDADLYAWKPRLAFRPPYVSNARGSDRSVEGFGFRAEEFGIYLVEVEAAGQDSVYRLLVGGDITGAASLASAAAALGVPDDADLRGTLPGGTRVSLAEKKRPEHPLTLSTPLGLPDAEVLDEVPRPSPTIRGYLPLVHRDR